VKKMKMNRYLFWILFLLVSGLILGSCNRKMAPAAKSNGSKVNYDLAKFNWAYVEGIKQKLLGNGGEALKYLEGALEINPECDAAYYQMAQIVGANGDLANGKRYLKKALELDEKNIWYLMMMGGFYYQERKLDSAIYYYENAVKVFPDEESLQLTLGNLYSENKNFDKAINIFDSFDKKYGVNDNSTVSSIRAMISEGSFDSALIKAEQLIKEEPDEVLYNGLLSEIYEGKGEGQKAREVYDKLLERNPDDPRIQLAICDFLVREKNYTELFLLLNNVILNTKVKREDKIALFARLTDLQDLVSKKSDDMLISMMVFEANYKDDDIIPLLRPDLLVKLGKLDEAGLRLEEIIKASPENYYAWEKLLMVLNQKKDYRNLMIRGEECATKFNRSFLAKILYANGALESKKFDIALEELRKAEILAGDNKEFLTQVLTMRADVYYRMKDYLKAFETFETAIKTNGDDLTVINNYAYYLAEQNRNLKEAEEMARKVIEKEKNNSTYLDTYAWVLYKRGKLKEAARIMEGIINSDEAPDAEWYEHYGFILSGQHNCVKAIESWNYALKLDSTKLDLKEEISNCGK
jgi:tetratricopeptide (TPR) repeat protein